MTRERKDKSCARVEQYTTGTVGNIERHNERRTATTETSTLIRNAYR